MLKAQNVRRESISDPEIDGNIQDQIRENNASEIHKRTGDRGSRGSDRHPAGSFHRRIYIDQTVSLAK